MDKKTENKIIWLGILMFIVAFLTTLAMDYTGAETQQQSLGDVKVGTQISLIQNCLNSTYANITRYVYPNKTIVNVNWAMTKSGDDYSYPFNVTEYGQYMVYGKCNENGILVNWVYDFGQDPPISLAIMYIGLIVLLIVFMVLCMASFIKFDNLLNRVGMIGLSYLFLLGISFIAWNLASDFLGGSPFIVQIFRIFFFVLMSAGLPLFIGGITWYFLMLFKIKEIQRLMDRGFSMEEAENRYDGRNR